MIAHTDLGGSDKEQGAALRKFLIAGKIAFAGNRKLKIYGTLKCKSGKRMKVQNRVFFKSEKEAINAGYRPCGHCLREKYLGWKEENGSGDI